VEVCVVVVCCDVLRCVSVCRSVPQQGKTDSRGGRACRLRMREGGSCNMLQCVVCALQYIAVCCVCVAVYCSVSQ